MNEERTKDKSKFERWLHAVKNPSQRTIIANQLAWSFGMTLGLLAAFIMLLITKQWVWAFVVFCGFMMNIWQTIALNQALKAVTMQAQAMKALQDKSEDIWKDLVSANKPEQPVQIKEEMGETKDVQDNN